MHKLLNTRIQLSLLVILSMQYSLHGMLSAENEDNKNLMWKVVIANSLSRHDYHTYRSVARLNREHNKIVEDTYRFKKKCIEDYMEGKNYGTTTGSRSWNRDFSKYAWISIIDSESGEKNLKLYLFGLPENSGHVMGRYYEWQGFHFPVFEDNIRPFFDEDGRVCFYGFGHIPKNTYLGNFFLNEYCISLDGYATLYVCRMLDAYDYIYDYEQLINFPILMKELLQSSIIDYDDGHEKLEHKDIKTRYRHKINLPEDYKTFKQHSFALPSCNHQSYDDLPKKFKKSIDARYEERQKKKKVMEK